MKALSTAKIADVTAVGADVEFDIETRWAHTREVHAEWTETTVSATAALQISFDNVIWTDVETPTAISGATSKSWTVDRYVPYMRVELDWTSGAVTTFKAYAVSLPY